MQIKSLNRNDAKSLNRWLYRRGAVTVPFESMPKLSFIIPGIAAFGIRQCEGDVGILDSLVTNPYVSAPTRDKALNTVFQFVLDYKGFKGILGFTIDNNTLERALRHGFKKSVYTALSYTKE